MSELEDLLTAYTVLDYVPTQRNKYSDLIANQRFAMVSSITLDSGC